MIGRKKVWIAGLIGAAFAVLVVGLIVFLNNESTPETSKVTLRLQWHIQTQFAGYYVASEKGFYKEEGLNVAIEQGGYGQNCLTTVGEGIEEFGTKWMADLVAAGDSYMSLANIIKDNGLMLVSKNQYGIDTVEKFAGRSVSIWFIGNEYQLYVLLDKFGISKKMVNIVSQKWDMSQFLNDEVQVSSAMVYNELLTLYAQGYKQDELNLFSFRDLGVGFPGQNIFTSRKYYLENHEICQRFVRASLKGWAWAIAHPDEATNIVMKNDRDGILELQHQRRQMDEIVRLTHVDKYPLGIHRTEDYSFIETVFKKYGIIDKAIDTKSLYTNEFVDIAE